MAEANRIKYKNQYRERYWFFDLAQNIRQIALDLFCNIGIVHRVHMNILDAVGIQINNLIGGISDAGLFHSCRRRTELIQQTLETLGNITAGHLDGALHLLGIGDGHNTGNNGYDNALLPDLIEKIIQQIVVKKHLGSQKLAAGLHLFFHPHPGYRCRPDQAGYDPGRKSIAGTLSRGKAAAAGP